MKESDLNLITKENNESLKHYDSIVDAMIVDNPRDMAITMLYQLVYKTSKYAFKLFSTIEHAQKWLEVVKTPNNIGEY